MFVGQEQDAVGGGFNVEESFVGEMSQMVVFDYALSPDEVAELATPQKGSCAAVYGQLLSWTDVLIGLRHGDVIVVNQSRCLGERDSALFSDTVRHTLNKTWVARPEQKINGKRTKNKNRLLREVREMSFKVHEQYQQA